MQNRVITLGSLFDGIGGFPLVSMYAEGFFRRFMEKQHAMRFIAAWRAVLQMIHQL